VVVPLTGAGGASGRSRRRDYLLLLHIRFVAATAWHREEQRHSDQCDRAALVDCASDWATVHSFEDLVITRSRTITAITRDRGDF
jgi:hypothetical protein